MSETTETHTAVLNVGGVRHEVRWATLKKKPSTKLGDERKLRKYYRPNTNEYYFDRSPRLFDYILNYYRCDELHINKSQCASEFVAELSFWEIEEDALGSCCWLGYKSQGASHVVHKEFESKREKMLQQEETNTKPTSWGRFRARGWTFLNDPFSSKGAMVGAHISETRWKTVVNREWLIQCKDHLTDCGDHSHYRDKMIVKLNDGISWQDSIYILNI